MPMVSPGKGGGFHPGSTFLPPTMGTERGSVPEIPGPTTERGCEEGHRKPRYLERARMK